MPITPSESEAVPGLHDADALDHGVERLVPRDGFQLAILAQQRMRGAARSIENVVFAEALGAKLAAIYRVVGIAACRDCLAILHADQHAAADRAIAASGLHPPLGDAGC